MSLDKLYNVVKVAKYPIHSREELMKVIGKEIILFDGKYLNAEEIAVHIDEYPLHRPSDVVKWFLYEMEEEYTNEEGMYLSYFDKMAEG